MRLAALTRLLLLLAGLLLAAALLLAGLLARILILLARLLIGVAHVRFSLADRQLAITGAEPIGCGAKGVPRSLNVSAGTPIRSRPPGPAEPAAKTILYKPF
jgi:hypothetical protein